MTCACILLYLACIVFLRLLHCLYTFYFACILFRVQGLVCDTCIWMETALLWLELNQWSSFIQFHSQSDVTFKHWLWLQLWCAYSEMASQNLREKNKFCTILLLMNFLKPNNERHILWFTQRIIPPHFAVIVVYFGGIFAELNYRITQPYSVLTTA